jgi:hypothetical protein
LIFEFASNPFAKGMLFVVTTDLSGELLIRSPAGPERTAWEQQA